MPSCRYRAVSRYAHVSNYVEKDPLRLLLKALLILPSQRLTGTSLISSDRRLVPVTTSVLLGSRCP